MRFEWCTRDMCVTILFFHFDSRPPSLPSNFVRLFTMHATCTFHLLTTCSTWLPSFILIEHEDVMFHVFWECRLLRSAGMVPAWKPKANTQPSIQRKQKLATLHANTEPTMYFIAPVNHIPGRQALHIELNSSMINVSCQICMKDLDSTALQPGTPTTRIRQPWSHRKKTFQSGPAGNVTRPLSSWKFARSWRFFPWYKSTLRDHR